MNEDQVDRDASRRMVEEGCPNDSLDNGKPPDGSGVVEDGPPCYGGGIEQLSSGRLEVAQDRTCFSAHRLARCPDSL